MLACLNSCGLVNGVQAGACWLGLDVVCNLFCSGYSAS